VPFQRKPQQRRQGEPTAAEREAFDELLLGEDLEGALAKALDYALRLTGKNETMARQLVLQARTLLWERCSWNPERGELGEYLCGVVRSVRSTEARRGVTERENEVEYLTEVDTIDGSHAKSPEELHTADEESEAARDEAAAELEKLRARFIANGDEVNLDWIKYSLEGIEDLAEMVRLSGRKIEDFYRARDRRVRLVQRMLREKTEPKETS
jgi:hypothetical protein